MKNTQDEEQSSSKARYRGVAACMVLALTVLAVFVTQSGEAPGDGSAGETAGETAESSCFFRIEINESPEGLAVSGGRRRHQDGLIAQTSPEPQTPTETCAREDLVLDWTVSACSAVSPFDAVIMSNGTDETI